MEIPSLDALSVALACLRDKLGKLEALLDQANSPSMLLTSPRPCRVNGQLPARRFRALSMRLAQQR